MLFFQVRNKTIEVGGQLGGSCYQRKKNSRRWKDTPYKGTVQKRDHICPLPRKCGVTGHGRTEAASELAVRRKARKFPHNSWIWKVSCSIFFSSLSCQLPKGHHAKEAGCEAEFLLSMTGLCGAAPHSCLKLTRSPQICTAVDTSFTTHFSEGSLKILFSWLLKNVLEVPTSWPRSSGPPLSPPRASPGVSGEAS